MATLNPAGTAFIQALLLGTALPVVWGGAGPLGATSLAAPAPNKTSQTLQQSQPQQAARSAPAAALVRSLERLFVQPRPASQPKTTQSSATRSGGKCAPHEAEIRAIAPPGGYGLTLSDRPAITFQLPPTSAQSIALVFHTPKGDTYESARFPLPPHQSLQPLQPLAQAQIKSTQPQWVSLQLPLDHPGLQAHQPYRWSLVLVCGEAIEPDDPTFSGWIEYRPTDLSTALPLLELSPQQRLRWYAQQGYWYDLVPLTSPSLVAL